MGHVIAAPWSAHMERCAQDVEQAIEQEHVTGRVREFLCELAQSLHGQAEVQRRQETDEEVTL